MTFKDVILKRKKEEWSVGVEMVRRSPPFPLQPTRDCPLHRAEAWEGENNSKEEERVCARKDKFRSHNFCTHCVGQPYSLSLSFLFWKKKSVYTCVWEGGGLKIRKGYLMYFSGFCIKKDAV